MILLLALPPIIVFVILWFVERKQKLHDEWFWSLDPIEREKVARKEKLEEERKYWKDLEKSRKQTKSKPKPEHSAYIFPEGNDAENPF